MLEQHSLFLKPWLHSRVDVWPKTLAQRPFWTRAIVNPTTERSLGFAVWHNSFSGLLSWLGRKKIQVFEAEDASLLMTVYRSWSFLRMWEILDAEEHLVGQLFRGAIYDGRGIRLASLSAEGDGCESVWQAETGQVLGSWQEIPGQGCYFRFGADLGDSPFVRMATLAGVLALPPWPGDLSPLTQPAS